ncbi:hypothetical protein [Bradyrhizobium barranii]
MDRRLFALDSAPSTTIEEWLPKQRVPLKDADTVDTAIDGRPDLLMMEYRRDEAIMHHNQAEGLATSDCTWPEVEKRIGDNVSKIAKSPNVWPAKRYRAVGFTGRTAQGNVEFAKIRIDMRGYIDAAGLLLSVPSIQKQVVDHLLALARADYSDEAAMTPRQRMDAITQAKANKLLAERRACWWWRKLQEEGTRAQVPTSNPWAILDVCE